MSIDLLLCNGHVVTSTGLQDMSVGVTGGRIVKVAEHNSFDSVQRILDCDGGIIAPGLIDLQANGGGGAMVANGGVDTMRRIAVAHARTGTTSLFPTVITASVDEMCDLIGDVAAAAEEHDDWGAEIIGVHVEGPFLNPAKRGAHAKEFLLDPSVDVAKRLVQAGNGIIRYFTLAPELEGADAVIRYLHSQGISVSAGHTEASAEELTRATGSGLTLATHLFNAMRGLDSREPGTVGRVLIDDRLRTGLIADGIHVHPDSMRVAVRAKGPDGIFLVTDAVSPLGTSHTKFKLYGFDVEVRDGGCYTADGVLAGSAAPLHIGVANIHRHVGVPLLTAIAMATRQPAEVAGVSSRKGAVAEGQDADLLVLDTDLRPKHVVVRGRVLVDLSPLK